MPNTLEQLTTIFSQFGSAGIGVALAAVPVAAGLAAYITRMGSQAKIDRLEGEVSRIETKRTDEQKLWEERYAELQDKYQTIVRRGALIQSQIDAIRAEALEIAQKLDATDYSVLVPAPASIDGDQPDQLVFLIASGPQAARLRWIRVPMATSLSGQVYISGQPTIASPSPLGNSFATVTDKITNIKTNEALSICLRYKNRRVGVAQFLNKRLGRFNTDDIDIASSQCLTLAVRVGEFLSDDRRLAELGFSSRSDQYNVTLLFVDLSHYSRLFDSMDTFVIIALLNQYFEELTGIAARYKGRVDQYIGDGALIVFNADQNQQAHEQAALAAANEMRAAFQIMRDRWVKRGYQGTEGIFVRIGLSCGLATRAELGGIHSRRTTFIGQEVNSAALACELGARDRDTICVTRKYAETLGMDLGALISKAEPIYELRD
jgi:class 3 adenylate cyclase